MIPIENEKFFNQASGSIAPIPLTLLTGFLGAGKTTLLNVLLGDSALADTVVIINEFGEVGIDHLLVETSDEGLLLLSSGCLCCSVRGDLIATLEDLLRRRDNGRITSFQRVIIETTGLADPAPILQTLIYHPYLSMRFALDGVVTVVDSVNGRDTLDIYQEAAKQVAVADRLILTKTDLQDDAQTRRLCDLLKRLNPTAPIISSAQGADLIEQLLNVGLFNVEGKIPDVDRWLNAGAISHIHDHRHDINRHNAHIRAFCLTTAKPISRSRFEGFLDLLRSAHGPQLLRMKGIVLLAEDSERPVVIHGVQHVFHSPVTLSTWPDNDRTTKLVLIVRDLEEAFVRRLWGAFLGEVAIDAPDIAALTDNPLAL